MTELKKPQNHQELIVANPEGSSRIVKDRSDSDEATLDQNQLRQNGLLGIKGKKGLIIRILSFVWLAATITIVNVFGMKNVDVSNKYILYVTPPGLFFSIWGLIFALQAVVNLINLIKNVWTLKQHILLAINNALLILWTNIFNINNDPAVYCSFLILVPITPIVLLYWDGVGKIKPINWFSYLTRNSYAFYLGWVVAATNLNGGMIILYWWKADPKTQLIIFWVIAPLCALGITFRNIYRQKLEGLKSCWALWVSVIWAFTGAAITSHKCLNQGCNF